MPVVVLAEGDKDVSHIFIVRQGLYGRAHYFKPQKEQSETEKRQSLVFIFIFLGKKEDHSPGKDKNGGYRRKFKGNQLGGHRGPDICAYHYGQCRSQLNNTRIQKSYENDRRGARTLYDGGNNNSHQCCSYSVGGELFEHYLEERE
jgi:hypothetical protein